MVTVAAFVTAVFAAGCLSHLLRLPPLVGFLAAGFALNAVGVQELPALEVLADLGVTLLLFSIGLKLDVRLLLRREVWLTAVLHLVGSMVLAIAFLAGLGALGVALLAAEGLPTLALLALAVSFSSTVFVIKVLDERSESRSLYGRVAIGILILQDVAAVAFIVVSSGEPPSPWALALVLLLPAAGPLRALWSWLGHGEMLAVFGVFMALVPGYALFSAVGLKGDLGSLAMGLLLAGHAAASELSRTLLSVKDLLLVGFFVSIGFVGSLEWSSVGLGLALLLLLPVQGWLYMLLLRTARFRRRTAVLGGLVLTNHSEFGLIVAAIGLEAGLVPADWLVAVSVAVAASFLVSSMLNHRSGHLVPRLARWLPAADPALLHPDDRYVDLGPAEALVLGMGRVGAAAHLRLAARHGLVPLGIENDPTRVRALVKRGFAVVEADASDSEFWERVVSTSRVQVAILAMPFHGTNQVALAQLRASGFRGRVTAVAQFDDDATELLRDGADDVLQMYDGAGAELADRALASPGGSAPA